MMCVVLLTRRSLAVSVDRKNHWHRTIESIPLFVQMGNQNDVNSKENLAGRPFFGVSASSPLTVDLCHLEEIRGISPRQVEAVFFSLVSEIELFLIVLRSDRTQ